MNPNLAYRDPELASAMVAQIKSRLTRSWTLMEVCGGQTHAIVKNSIDLALGPEIEFVHGPGCPVCVTPLETLEAAHRIAAQEDVIFCTFGDMMRVPGRHDDLFSIKARGHRVETVYSPFEALELARTHPDRRVVFFAVGFETTAPANAMAVHLAQKEGLDNFYVLLSHALVPPVLSSLLQSPDHRIDGLLGPGHVCTVVGEGEYHALSRQFDLPIAIAGFELVDLLRGVLELVKMLESGHQDVVNAYERHVKPRGNERAKALMDEVFEVIDRPWRGLGRIPKSGHRLSYEYRAHDALRHFAAEIDDTGSVQENPDCICGKILRGTHTPPQCPSFGRDCTPETPLGSTMVSNEGACAAYYHYRGVRA